MSKLQSFKRLTVEDFDTKDRAMVGKIAYSINIFAEDVLNALNNNISIEDNLNIAKKDFTVVVDGSGNIVGNASLKTGLSHSCQGITVIKADNLTVPANIPTGTPFVTFSESSGLITISNITNLTATNQYKLKLVLF